MAKSCLQGAFGRHLKSKQAALDVDHVPVLNILWLYRLAANARPKINSLSPLHSVDYAGEMNVAEASIITYSARFHHRLVHGRRAIKRVDGRLIGKPGHGNGCRAVLQRHQRLVVVQLPLIAADELMLKIDNSLAGSCDFADQGQTRLAASATCLRAIREGLIGIV